MHGWWTEWPFSRACCISKRHCRRQKRRNTSIRHSLRRPGLRRQCFDSAGRRYGKRLTGVPIARAVQGRIRLENAALGHGRRELPETPDDVSRRNSRTRPLRPKRSKNGFSIAGGDLNYFFDQWLNSSGVPEFKQEYTVFRRKDGYKVVGQIKQDLDLFRCRLNFRSRRTATPNTLAWKSWVSPAISMC